MNEELQKQLAESIKGFSNAVSGAKDFAIEQAPDVIHQYLMWGLISGIITLVVCVAVIYISYLATFKWSNQNKDGYGDWKMDKAMSSVIGGIASILAITFLIASIFDIAKILISPKIYLIQQAASLIK